MSVSDSVVRRLFESPRGTRPDAPYQVLTAGGSLVWDELKGKAKYVPNEILHFGGGFFSNASGFSLCWCPSVACAQNFLGIEFYRDRGYPRAEAPTPNFSKPEFDVPSEYLGSPFTDYSTLEEVERRLGRSSDWHSTSERAYPNRGTYFVRETNATVDYMWSSRARIEVSPFVGVRWWLTGPGFVKPGIVVSERVSVEPVEEDWLVLLGGWLVSSGVFGSGVLSVFGGPELFADDADEGVVFWSADGEDLAEGEVEEWLGLIAGSLAKLGVVLSVRTLVSPWDEGAAAYVVEINGRSVELYTMRRGEPQGRPWLTCVLRPLEVLNVLLGEVGSVFRFGAVDPGGNDGLVVLLPESVWAGVKRAKVLKGVRIKIP